MEVINQWAFGCLGVWVRAYFATRGITGANRVIMSAKDSGVDNWWDDPRFNDPSQLPVVVQFSTDACIHCPDATLKVDAVAKTHQFGWHVDNAFTSSLATELEVHQLPAVLVFHSVERYKLYEKLRGDDVTRILQAECTPRFIHDVDF